MTNEELLEIWDNYFLPYISEWELDVEWSKDWITDGLDDKGIEYTDEDAKFLLEMAHFYQRKMLNRERKQ